MIPRGKWWDIAFVLLAAFLVYAFLHGWFDIEVGF